MILNIVAFFIGSYPYAQETYKDYYDNGNLKLSGQYDEDGNPTGKWTGYHKNKNLRLVLNLSTYEAKSPSKETETHRTNSTFGFCGNIEIKVKRMLKTKRAIFPFFRNIFILLDLD